MRAMRGMLISHRDDPRSLGAAIYGLVVVVSLLAVYGNDTGKSMLQIAGGIFVTAIVFWVAHVYTALVEHRRERGHRANFAEIRATRGRGPAARHDHADPGRSCCWSAQRASSSATRR